MQGLLRCLDSPQGSLPGGRLGNLGRQPVGKVLCPSSNKSSPCHAACGLYLNIFLALELKPAAESDVFILPIIYNVTKKKVGFATCLAFREL